MNRKSLKVSDRILDQMVAQMEASADKKPTCWVASATPCGTHTGRIIIASLEPFSVSDAVTAIHAAMQGSVIPHPQSFTLLQSEAHPGMNFASMHCYKGSFKVRPADEANMAKCTAITASTYLDVELGNVWERKQIGDKQYIVRANDDDLEEVMAIALTASVSPQAQVEPDGFIVRPKPNDYVVFFAAEKKDDGSVAPYMDVAQVTQIQGSSVGILIEDGGHQASAFLPAASIVNIIEIDANGNEPCALDPDHKLSRASILEYLKQAYGPEYAAALNTIK